MRRSTCKGSARVWVAWARITSRATGIAAGRCRCCSSTGWGASRTRCARCSRRTCRSRISSASRNPTTLRSTARPWTGRRRSGRSPSRTSSRRSTAKGAAANQQWAIIAPTGHCGYSRATDHTVVGERDMGDARLNNLALGYQDLMYEFFDRFLKGTNDGVMDTLPKIHYYTMGLNKWQTADQWPPKGATPQTFYLSSGGKANTLTGDCALTPAAPAADKPDAFTYDPMHPVMSFGGNVCCQGKAVTPGAMNQRKMEENPDVVVYTAEPFTEGTEVSGPITPTLYVASDAKDTDFTIKVIDVFPDGTAYNLDESIQRMRYRDGYDKPRAGMEEGKVYKGPLPPLTTSNYFPAGHRLRIEVSSSNFPRFDRNLNTGGRNFDETTGVVAHNTIHHSTQYPSSLTVTTVKRVQP